MAHESVNFPPAPWRLEGAAIVAMKTVDIAIARSYVPRELTIMPVLPRKTLALMVVAGYGPGSALEYHELAVAPALTFSRGKIGFWISHIYVDDAASMAAGQQLWGLPKELAAFESSVDEKHLEVTRNGESLCLIRWNACPKLTKAPVFLPAMSSMRSRFSFFKASGKSRIGTCRAVITTAATSPFKSLGFDQCDRVFWSEQLKLNVTAPR
jgi:hypothetical protein